MDTIASQSTDSWVQLGWLGRCKVCSPSPVPCAICLAEGLAIQDLAHGDQRTLYVLSKFRYRLKKKKPLNRYRMLKNVLTCQTENKIKRV